MGEIDPAFLDHRALGEHATTATAAFRPVPGVFLEAALAVLALQFRADAVLQIEQIVLHRLGGYVIHVSLAGYDRFADQ